MHHEAYILLGAAARVKKSRAVSAAAACILAAGRGQRSGHALYPHSGRRRDRPDRRPRTGRFCRRQYAGGQNRRACRSDGNFAVGHDRHSQPRLLLRDARRAPSGVFPLAAAAACVSGQPPLRRHAQPHDRRRRPVRRRPAHGLHAAVYRRSDHCGHARLHAFDQLEDHARRRAADAAFSAGGKVHRGAYLFHVPAAIQGTRGADRADQRAAERPARRAGFLARGREPAPV